MDKPPSDPSFDGIDNDANGFVDDVYGWDFFGDSNRVIDHSYQDSVTSDTLTFFDIQSKMADGTASKDEMIWASFILQDEEFRRDVNIFGNYIHGTHVADVAVRTGPSNFIQSLKILSAEPSEKTPKLNKKGKKVKTLLNAKLEVAAREALKDAADNQTKTFSKFSAYAYNNQADVLNGSFGISTLAVKPSVALLLSELLGDNTIPSDELIETYSIFFVKEVLKNIEKSIDAAPNILFVFAAGNDGTNNTKFPEVHQMQGETI